MPHTPITVLSAVMGVLCVPSHAGIMLLDDGLRSQNYGVSTSPLDPSIEPNAINIHAKPPGLFADWDSAYSIAIPDASVDSTYTSSISSGFFECSSYIHASLNNSGSQYLESYSVGISVFQVDFTITEVAEFDLNVNLDASGPIGQVAFRINEIGTFEDLYSIQTTSGSASLVDTISLQPGSYNFHIGTVLFMLGDDGFSGESTLSYSASLIAVPAPSSLALLTLSGLLTARRRRQPELL